MFWIITKQYFYRATSKQCLSLAVKFRNLAVFLEQKANRLLEKIKGKTKS